MDDLKIVLTEEQARKIIANAIGINLDRSIDHTKVLWMLNPPDKVQSIVHEVWIFV